MPYSGNKLHPTQKPVTVLVPLIRSFSSPKELVLDPFAGSGSSCAAALLINRRYFGIEMDVVHFGHASARMERVKERIAAKRQGAACSIMPISRFIGPNIFALKGGGYP